jgi:hypothetical protein
VLLVGIVVLQAGEWYVKDKIGAEEEGEEGTEDRGRSAQAPVTTEERKTQ